MFQAGSPFGSLFTPNLKTRLDCQSVKLTDQEKCLKSNFGDKSELRIGEIILNS